MCLSESSERRTGRRAAATTNSIAARSRLARQTEIDKLRMSQILTGTSDFELKVRAILALPGRKRVRGGSRQKTVGATSRDGRRRGPVVVWSVVHQLTVFVYALASEPPCAKQSKPRIEQIAGARPRRQSPRQACASVAAIDHGSAEAALRRGTTTRRR
jgi:hypothetical protein